MAGGKIAKIFAFFESVWALFKHGYRLVILLIVLGIMLSAYGIVHHVYYGTRKCLAYDRRSVRASGW